MRAVVRRGAWAAPVSDPSSADIILTNRQIKTFSCLKAKLTVMPALSSLGGRWSRVLKKKYKFGVNIQYLWKDLGRKLEERRRKEKRKREKRPGGFWGIGNYQCTR